MRILLIALFLFFSNVLMAQKHYLFIGTYTHTGSKGIYVYQFDAATGVATPVSHTDSVVNPSYLALSADGRFVYAVNETGGDKPGGVSAFAFDAKEGKLQLINQQLSGGDHPCYIAVTKDNKWAAVGNYSGGNFSLFPIGANGSLQPAAQTVQHKGSSANKERQEAAHVHATVFSPDEKFLLTPDLGTDKIMLYAFDKNRTQPAQPHTQPFAQSVEGSGPRHITFHPNGAWAYHIEELTGTVVAHQYKNGNLKMLQRLPAHEKGSTSKKGSADIHVSPDGKFLYASNRGDENNLAIFAIDAATGKLTPKGYQSVMGKSPRNFIIDPSGKFLLVANQETDNIVIFRRNEKTGLLKETGQQISLPKPVCLKLMPIKK